MKKDTFSFSAVRSGSRLHRFFLSKTKRRRLRNAAVCVAASVCISADASAQCNTFLNADAANPLLSVIPAGTSITGFAFADIDGDGDQDVYLSYGSNSLLHLYRNVGTKEHPIFKDDTGTGFGSQLAGNGNEFMQFVDIDGDGDLDYFASESARYYNSAASIQFYRNEGTATVPRFVASQPDFFPPNLSSYVYQTFSLADIDGDGDYDLYVCDVSYFNFNSYNQRVYFNQGSKTNPVFTTPVGSPVADGTSRTYYDWNKDGLLDFFSVPSFFTARGYYKNIGPKEAPLYMKANSEGPTFQNGGPYRFVDLNNDGAPEVFAYGAHYSTLAPVSVIADSVLKNGSAVLYSRYRNAAYTYRWQFNGQTVTGADKSFIIAKKPGTYTLYVTNDCGTGISLDYLLTKNTAVTTGERIGTLPVVAAETSVKEYPNPFAESFTLQLPGTACMIKLTDVAGRVLLTQNTSAKTVQLGQGLAKGVCFVQVWQSGTMIYETTLIKQ